MSSDDLAHRPFDSAVHRTLLAVWIERGVPPTLAELGATLDASSAEVRAALTRLEGNHGVVLHPGTHEVWLVHPFSTTPTLFHVAGSERGWWSPCIWCALGVAVLVPEPVRITTTLGGEAERCELTYDSGVVAPSGRVAHFPVPVARAWDNVHRHCACTLVFADLEAVDPWCERHGITRGEVLPLEQVAELARVWYGGHLAPDWRKPTASEARAKFESAGLTAPHWHVPPGDQRF